MATQRLFFLIVTTLASLGCDARTTTPSISPSPTVQERVTSDFHRVIGHASDIVFADLNASVAQSKIVLVAYDRLSEIDPAPLHNLSQLPMTTTLFDVKQFDFSKEALVVVEWGALAVVGYNLFIKDVNWDETSNLLVFQVEKSSLDPSLIYPSGLSSAITLIGLPRRSFGGKTLQIRVEEKGKIVSEISFKIAP
jgi:hypothetical protein